MLPKTSYRLTHRSNNPKNSQKFDIDPKEIKIVLQPYYYLDNVIPGIFYAKLIINTWVSSDISRPYWVDQENDFISRRNRDMDVKRQRGISGIRDKKYARPIFHIFELSLGFLNDWWYYDLGDLDKSEIMYKTVNVLSIKQLCM